MWLCAFFIFLGVELCSFYCYIIQFSSLFLVIIEFMLWLINSIDHYRNAIKELSTGLSLDNSNIECLYLRASCYHAIGEYKEAVCDFFCLHSFHIWDLGQKDMVSVLIF